MADPLTILGAGALVAGGIYLAKRDALKDGDKRIAEERERELQRLRQDASSSSSLPREVAHLLHPHHRLALEVAPASGQGWTCSACWTHGPPGAPRYLCACCDFQLHLACALASEPPWTARKHQLETTAHKHRPVTLVRGTSEFKCSHYKSQGTTVYRYKCEVSDCLKRTHLICASSPTMLFSFLHPNHVLELKTRHRFKKCAVCRHGGKSNARVYTCEECDVFIHPECAQVRQYWESLPLHPACAGGLPLVYRRLPKGKKTPCVSCGSKCKGWTYVCPASASACRGVSLHRSCLISSYNNPRSSKEEGGHGKEILETFVEHAVEAALEFLLNAISS